MRFKFVISVKIRSSWSIDILTDGLQVSLCTFFSESHLQFRTFQSADWSSGRVYLTDFGSSQLMGKQSEYSIFQHPFLCPGTGFWFGKTDYRISVFQLRCCPLQKCWDTSEIRTLTNGNSVDNGLPCPVLTWSAVGPNRFNTINLELLNTIVYVITSIIHILRMFPGHC
jgi:hypothetical protein